MGGEPTAPPPPYEGSRDASAQPGAAPATNLPNQPIAMQPVGQPGMNTANKVTPLHLLSDVGAQYVDCQMCQQRARTRVEKEGEGMQFLTGALLCLVCICLAPLPCCLHWFEQTNWYCTNCSKQIATRAADSPVHVFPPPHALHVPSQYAPGPGPGAPPPHANPVDPAAPQHPPPSHVDGAPQPQAPMSPPASELHTAPGQGPQSPEIMHEPTPNQAPGGPDSLPMKN